MANPSWLKALLDACYHTYDPALHYDTEKGIVLSMLWRWEAHSPAIVSPWERPASLMHKYDTSSVEDIFVLLRRATREGTEHDQAFALILLGALATPEALDIVRSFLASPSLKVRWASAIALGRHKEERVFTLLQTLLLDGFLVSEREAEKGRARPQDAYPPIGDPSVAIEYEWYMHQRWECALVLGAWGNPCVVPLLREALQAAWKMEQAWPNYAGYTDGPEIWHSFQDRLAFALGQLGAWHVLRELELPEKRLIIATIYLALGALQVRDSSIFYYHGAQHLFVLPHHIQPSPSSLERVLARFPAEKQEQAKRLLANQMDFHERWLSEHADQESLLAQLPAEKQKRIKHVIAGHAERKARWLAENPYVEPGRVKQLLARHLGFSETEQDQYLRCFPEALSVRDKESYSAPRQQ